MRTPALGLATAYGAGLGLFANVDDSPRLLLALAALALLVGWLALGRRWLHFTLTCALLGFFLLGGATIGLTSAGVDLKRVDLLVARGEVDLSEAVRLSGWLRRAPEHKPFATIFELELESVETGGRQQPTSGGLRLAYFLPQEPDPPAPPLPALAYGNRLEILARVHLPVSHQNLGSFDRRAYLARQGIFLEGSLAGPELMEKLPGRRGYRLLAWVYSARTHLLGQLDELVPPDTHPDHNAVLRAMLLGDRSFLSHDLAESFRLSGAYHVLVVSGLHVGVLALFSFWFLRRLGLDEGATTLITLALLVLYLLLVEDRPPIERAVWMVAFYLGARLLFREVRLANPLALAALLVLFLHPDWLFDPGFQFSFGAVALIAFLALPWIERTSAPYRDALKFLDARERDDLSLDPRLVQFRHDLRATADLLSGVTFHQQKENRAALRFLTGTVRVGLRIWDFFLISLAIHLGLVLLTAFYFQRVIWVGLLTNILVVPLIGLLVPLGLAALAISLLWSAAGAVLAWATSALLGGLLWLVGSLSEFRISYGIPPPPLWLVVLYLAALVLLALAVERRRRQRWAFSALAALMLLVVVHPFPPQLHGTLEVSVLDVGQGDSLFLAFPNGETWLVDAGRAPVEIRAGYQVGEPVGLTVVTPYLRARGLKRLDRVWLTHAHHDHMGGLGVILTEFPVGSFHVGRNPESAAYSALLKEVTAAGTLMHTHAAGERFRVGEVQVEVLWPPADRPLGRSPENNDSIVLRLCQEAACVLLPGDIEVDVEQQLASHSSSLTAAALKVPHHGGRGAAGEEFLAAVHPQVAVISVGPTNPFGHPFPEVLDRLAAHAGRTFRTDQDGSVTLQLIEGRLQAQSYREHQRAQPYPNLWRKLAACARRTLQLESF